MYPRTDTQSSSVYYTKVGSGPAVILIHGFPESGTLWQNIVGVLSASATLIIPDLPGAGNTPLEGATSIDEMAAGIKEILDKEGIDKAIVAGHSMGGYVSLAFADKYPERTAGVSMIHSTPVADDDEKKVMRQKSIELIRKGGKRIFVSQMIPNLFSEVYKQVHPEVISARIDESMKMSDNGMINFYNAMMDRKGRTNILEGAAFPFQWIIGYNDNIMPYKKNLQYCYRSDVNFVSVYEDCGHMSMYEAPEKLAWDLQYFIKYCYALS